MAPIERFIFWEIGRSFIPEASQYLAQHIVVGKRPGPTCWTRDSYFPFAFRLIESPNRAALLRIKAGVYPSWSEMASSVCDCVASRTSSRSTFIDHRTTFGLRAILCFIPFTFNPSLDQAADGFGVVGRSQERNHVLNHSGPPWFLRPYPRPKLFSHDRQRCQRLLQRFLPCTWWWVDFRMFDQYHPTRRTAQRALDTPDHPVFHNQPKPFRD
jgi:hypothetical protein